jgi:beta-lactamase class A
MMTRRGFILTASALAGSSLFGTAGAASTPDGLAKLESEIARIEHGVGGWLGVAVLDTGSGAHAGHRADARFPITSTFKFLAAAAVLKRVDDGKDQLTRRITFTARDLVTYSPVTGKHVSDGMTLADICEAAITVSDNTAGNLLLASIGGPPGLTKFARSLGDTVTRLDRIEPALNEATPGDPRDTTTPRAMLDNLKKLVLGGTLSDASKTHLKSWLMGNKTGAARLRAGLPRGWSISDKTGSGERGTTNDIAVLWPPGHAPVVVTAYLTNTTASLDRRNAAIAEVGRLVAAAVSG